MSDENEQIDRRKGSRRSHDRELLLQALIHRNEQDIEKLESKLDAQKVATNGKLTTQFRMSFGLMVAIITVLLGILATLLFK